MYTYPSATNITELWFLAHDITMNFSHLLLNVCRVVTLPSQDVNGEDGTIQAGEYAKGDTATLYVYQDEGKVSVSAIKQTFNQ